MASTFKESLESMLINRIGGFVSQASGLDLSFEEEQSKLVIKQNLDGKSLSFEANEVEEVIDRVDSDGKEFVQVNFISGKKILLTENLVGFKPAQMAGLDMTKLPRVVTTSDLFSVVEAIEESIEVEEGIPPELDVLRKVFDSVICGGEDVGFDLTSEKVWLQYLEHPYRRASC